MRIAFALGFAAFALRALAAESLPVPRFTDPGRKTKLAAAFPEIESIFEKYQRDNGVPGMVFGVVIDGELLLVKGLGVRDRKSNDAVNEETAFRIASMTKSFTVLAILKLRDEGKLSLDDTVAKWIPEAARFAYPTRDTAPLRLRELLTHGAGFPDDNPWGDRQLAASEAKLTEWLQRGLPFSTPPNTAYEYSNYGFALLGRIVTKASGVPYRVYLEKRILAPLGMKSSSLEPAEIPAAVRAAGYKKVAGEMAEEPSLPHGTFGAMGGLVTTAKDLARYVSYQLAAFPPRDEAEGGPVRRSSQREMQQAARPRSLAAERAAPDQPLQVVSASYGFGLRISRDCRFDHIVGHGGGLPGFGSYMMWLPNYGVGIFAMTNLTYASTAPPISEAFDALRKTGALQPRQLPPANVLLSTRDSIVRLWSNWNDGEAEKLAADNFFLDSPAAARKLEMEKLKAQHGQCRPTGEVEPANLLSGKFRMSCERGFVDAAFTLAPTMPPTLQSLEFRSAVPLDTAVREAAGELASLIGAPSEERLKKYDLPGLRSQMEALRSSYGGCRLGETLAGDGKTDVRVRFQCERGSLDVQLRFDEQRKLHAVAFAKPTDIACVP